MLRPLNHWFRYSEVWLTCCCALCSNVYSMLGFHNRLVLISFWFMGCDTELLRNFGDYYCLSSRWSGCLCLLPVVTGRGYWYCIFIILFYFTLFYFILFYFTLFYFYFILLYFIFNLLYFTLFYFLFYFSLFYFTLFYYTLLYFTLFYFLFYFSLFYFTLFYCILLYFIFIFALLLFYFILLYFSLFYLYFTLFYFIFICRSYIGLLSAQDIERPGIGWHCRAVFAKC